MRIYKSSLYDTFQCIASACPDSCCKEWSVTVDPESAAMYRQLPGELGDRLRQVMAEEDGDTILTIENGRCPMWRKDGLCRIQAEMGHDALCKTCREFPRLTHDYGDFQEWGLELSCPEAARLILSFPAAPFSVTEVPGGEDPEYDPDDMRILLRTRETMQRILADDSYSVPQALTLGLLYGYRAQNVLDGGEEEAFEPDAELSFAASLAKTGDVTAFTSFYQGLEILTEDWRRRLDAPQGNGHWDERLRLLARYGVDRYWLQAISDFDLVGRAKMIIASCLLVRHLGGDFVQTAQLYAKEIENNWENVEAILDGAYTSPALTDDKLLGMLLEV